MLLPALHFSSRFLSTIFTFLFARMDIFSKFPTRSNKYQFPDESCQIFFLSFFFLFSLPFLPYGLTRNFDGFCFDEWWWPGNIARRRFALWGKMPENWILSFQTHKQATVRDRRSKMSKLNWSIWLDSSWGRWLVNSRLKDGPPIS